MRLLITGGCGFLGSHLVEHFLKADPSTEIVIIDKLTYASTGFDRLRDIADAAPELEIRPRVKVLGCDLANAVPDGILREVGRVDYILHAAAESHVDNSIIDPLPFLQSNVIGTHNLLMMARVLAHRSSALRRVFMISTDEVYGPAAPGGAGYDEGARFRPTNPYAASKAGAEAVAMAYRNTYGVPVTIVNTMNLIGERQHPEKFVPLVIRKILANETVVIHADPTRTVPGSRFYLHCRTFADALGFLMSDKGRDGAARWYAGGDLPIKIHVSGEEEISNLEMAHRIAGFIAGSTVKTQIVDSHSSRPGHDLRYAMDDSLLRRMGWERPMGIWASLEKTVAWYLAHRRWLAERGSFATDDSH